MSDQQAPPEADTPAVAGPTEAPGTQEQPQTDWEKRYQDLQPEYTRATQRLSELEQQQKWYELAMTTDDPDTHRQALQHLGYDVPDDDVEDDDPTAYEAGQFHDPRLDEPMSWKEQQEQAAREAAGFEFVSQHIDSEIKRLGVDQLSDKSREWVLSPP